MYNKPKEKSCIGFITKETETEIKKQRNAVLSSDALIKYGMTPELVGRLPVIATLDNLTEDDLLRILTEPKNALTQEYKTLLAADGIRLEFQKETLREIVKLAMKRNTGARGLRSIMEELMLDIMYKAPSKKGKISRYRVSKKDFAKLEIEQ